MTNLSIMKPTTSHSKVDFVSDFMHLEPKAEEVRASVSEFFKEDLSTNFVPAPMLKSSAIVDKANGFFKHDAAIENYKK